MFNSHTAYTVGTAVYLDKIFEYLPGNAFINKGRCGIGGTTLELKNKNRCSLIVAATVGILKDKKKSNPDLFIVWADVKLEDVKVQLALQLPAQKIMCTPEGIKKVINAAIELEMYDQLKEEWFLLLDECHTFISEDYRKNILRPFEYFWDFKLKAIISATPYYFSDERFRTLDYYEVNFTEPLGTITLVNCKSVFGTLNSILEEAKSEKGRYHIFLSSVHEWPHIVKRCGIEDDSNFYCADDKDKENMKKLGDLQGRYVEQPDKDNFAKFNFYTTKYYEGWDLFDDDATIILVTSVRNAHTKVSISMKLKQAAGRLRQTTEQSKSVQIIHLTDTHHIQTKRKSLADYKEEYTEEANYLLKEHQQRLEFYKKKGRQPDMTPDLERFADIDHKSRVATFNATKLDQQINQAYSNECYNNIDLIRGEWEKAYYDVEVEYSNILLPETRTTMKRKSKATQLKEDYHTIINQKDSQEWNFGESPIDRIKRTNPLAYQAATLLNEATMDSLGYNIKRVQQEVILASNEQKRFKLIKLVNNEFKQGQRFSIVAINDKLDSIYRRLDLRDSKTGEIRKAKATDLNTLGWFDIDPCKLADKQGRYSVHGYQVIRKHLTIQTAA